MKHHTVLYGWAGGGGKGGNTVVLDHFQLILVHTSSGRELNSVGISLLHILVSTVPPRISKVIYLGGGAVEQFDCSYCPSKLTTAIYIFY